MKWVARWNLGLGTLLTGMVALRLLLWPMAHPACADCTARTDRPIWCDRINHVGTVYVNGGTDSPAAFQETAATFDGDTAYFQVYALAGDIRHYANVTGEYRFRNHPDGPRVIRVQVRPAHVRAQDPRAAAHQRARPAELNAHGRSIEPPNEISVTPRETNPRGS